MTPRHRLTRAEVARLGSRGELTLAVQLEQAGIPFEREYRFHPERRWRADFFIGPVVGRDLPGGYFDGRILVEVDGGTWTSGRHNNPASIAAEYEKRNNAAILGYRVIACTTEQVADGTCLGWIEAALGRKAAA